MNNRTLALVLAVCALPAAAATVKLPIYVRKTLPNGVVVDMMPVKGVPLVDFRLLIGGGIESDPPGLAGLASITAELLRSGTDRYSAVQFSETLDSLGGTLNAHADHPLNSVSALSAEFLSKDFAAAIDLLADAVLHPTFPENEVRKRIAARVDEAKAVKDDPQAALMGYFQAFYFGPAHPYGHPADETTLGRIQRADIENYHRRFHTGRNLTLIVAGGFDPATAFPLVEKAFGGLAAGQAFQGIAAAPPKAKPDVGARLLLVDKPGATQTYFVVAQPGIARTDPDRVKLMLVNSVFGGQFLSMLNEELRVNSGLTYGAASEVEMPRLPGSILIRTFTKTATTGKAIDLALSVLRRLSSEGLTPERLAAGKAYLMGQYPTRRLETAEELTRTLGDLETNGLGRGEVDNLFSRLDEVTLDEANAAAKKHYGSRELTFVLIGDAAKIRDSARKYAASISEVSVSQPGIVVTGK